MKRLLSAPLDRPTRRATSASEGGVSPSVESKNWQARATGLLRPRAACQSRGLQRLQGRKPTASAASGEAWNATVPPHAGRAAQAGRQYTPLRLDQDPNPPVDS